jgi:hypothetical protein
MRQQKSVQMFNFAAALNSDFAKKVADSPKVTASAAVLGFSRLDPETQLSLIGEARQKHLEAFPAATPLCNCDE